MSISIQTVIQQRLSAPKDRKLEFVPIAGGCINETASISWPGHQVFCKLNSASTFPGLFEAEKAGLEFIGSQQVIRVPSVIDSFETNGQQVLLLEWIDEGNRTEKFWTGFGQQLAALHQISSREFGFGHNNYMGSIPQSNEASAQWDRFFIDQRLKPLVRQCLDKRLLEKEHAIQFEKLYKVLTTVFDCEQHPALVHGDLWSGNFMCDKNEQAVLIDPAVYFGHPAADLGMTTLFGGFRAGFYEAYNYHSPFPKNHDEQWKVCNLYPLLIHLLLFGKSYLSQIETTLDAFA
jgi:protein-ribulosamine 3-kinase